LICLVQNLFKETAGEKELAGLLTGCKAVVIFQQIINSGVREVYDGLTAFLGDVGERTAPLLQGRLD
jgi:hypothetical protein